MRSLTGCASFEYFTARVISRWRNRYGKIISGIAGVRTVRIYLNQKEISWQSVPRESLLRYTGPFKTAHFQLGNLKGLKREKKSAVAYQPRSHVLEHCSAGHTIERGLHSSPLFVLLERNQNGNLPTTHGGHLPVPASCTA